MQCHRDVKTILDNILDDVRREVDAARRLRPPADLRSMAADAPPVKNLVDALSGEALVLIAEIKEKSPSVGPMRPENVKEAPSAYEEFQVVKALSILTNQTHFGGSVELLATIQRTSSKPILRKDFFLDEYQIREARAFGADAVLLMANVLDQPRLQGFYDLVRELGMEALFEVHTAEEIALLPADAKIVGINSRKFKTTEGFSGAEGHSSRDFSVDLDVFSLVRELPENTIRVAESGLTSMNLGSIQKDFHAALVGTSLLRDARGIRAPLEEFAEALEAVAS